MAPANQLPSVDHCVRGVRTRHVIYNMNRWCGELGMQVAQRRDCPQVCDLENRGGLCWWQRSRRDRSSKESGPTVALTSSTSQPRSDAANFFCGHDVVVYLPDHARGKIALKRRAITWRPKSLGRLWPHIEQDRANLSTRTKHFCC
jgi:hypothetical protein